MGYTPHKVPQVPLSFPQSKKTWRGGASEEGAMRPAADLGLNLGNLQRLMPPEPPAITQRRSETIGDIDEMSLICPAWMTSEPTFSPPDINFFKPRPDLRTYFPAPQRCETDADWELRPHARHVPLAYDSDTSLRSRLVFESMKRINFIFIFLNFIL